MGSPADFSSEVGTAVANGNGKDATSDVSSEQQLIDRVNIALRGEDGVSEIAQMAAALEILDGIENKEVRNKVILHILQEYSYVRGSGVRTSADAYDEDLVDMTPEDLNASPDARDRLVALGFGVMQERVRRAGHALAPIEIAEAVQNYLESLDSQLAKVIGMFLCIGEFEKKVEPEVGTITHDKAVPESRRTEIIYEYRGIHRRLRKLAKTNSKTGCFDAVWNELVNVKDEEARCVLFAEFVRAIAGHSEMHVSIDLNGTGLDESTIKGLLQDTEFEGALIGHKHHFGKGLPTGFMGLLTGGHGR